MKTGRLSIILTILFSSLSCSIPISSNENNYAIFYYTKDDKCKIDILSSYELPPLPDVESLDNDFMVIDSLVDHIRVLRQDLINLSSSGTCDR